MALDRSKLHQNQMMSADFFPQTLVFNGGYETWLAGPGPFPPLLTPHANNPSCADYWFVLDTNTEAGPTVNLVQVQSSGTARSGVVAAQVNVVGSPSAVPNVDLGIWQGVRNPSEFVGKPLTFSAYVYTTSGGVVQPFVWWYDSLGAWHKTYGQPHSGSGTWEKLVAWAFIDEDYLLGIGSPAAPDPTQPVICGIAVIQPPGGPLVTFLVDEGICVAGRFHDGPTYVPYDPAMPTTQSGVDYVSLATAAPVFAYDLVSQSGVGVVQADIGIAGQVGTVAGFALDTILGPSVPNPTRVQFEGLITNPNWAGDLYYKFPGPGGPAPMNPGEAVYAAGILPPPYPGLCPVPGMIFQFSSVNAVYLPGPPPPPPIYYTDALFSALLWGAPFWPPGTVWLQRVGFAATQQDLEVNIGRPVIL